MNPPALTATYTYNPSITAPSSSSTSPVTTTNNNVTFPDSKTFTYDLPPPPSHTTNSRNIDHHIEPLHTEPDLQSRTHHLRHLRTAAVDLQKEINAFLTAKMEEEKKLLLSQQGLVGNVGLLQDDNDVEVEEEEELDEETKRLEAEVERQRKEDEEEEKVKKMKGKAGGGKREKVKVKK